MLLHDLVAGLGIVEIVVSRGGHSDVDVTSIEHDSRAIVPGALFCCIPGDSADGHQFARDAVDAGAVACLVERVLDVGVPQVRVECVRDVLGVLCDRFFGNPSTALRVLGVTGTNGKTTTTYLLESIARARGERVGVIGTVGARVGSTQLPLRHTTPEATELQGLLARMRSDGVETVAMEVSSHALDQRRVDGTSFAAVTFTNLSHDHLDYHRDIDDYFDAKARLFDGRFSSLAVINADDARSTELARRARRAEMRVTMFGVTDGADVVAEDVDAGAAGTRFTLVDRRTGARVKVDSPLLGSFNVVNALAAGTTALVAGYDADAVAAGLSAEVRVPGRFERIAPDDHGPAVFVDYAHTPDALGAVLSAARPFVGRGGRLVVVFGCGGDRDRAKRAVMGRVASELADRIVVTSDNPRSEDPATIARQVVDGVQAAPNERVVVELDRRRAIRDALGDAHEGDVVVIAGKGHETGQTANGVTLPFDDRIVAREELERAR